MTYATVTELEERLEGFYSELYNDEKTGLVDTTQAEKDLADASSEVNASVAVRYAIPVVAPRALALLRSLSLTLAEELAWSRGGGDTIPQKVCDRVANARKLLCGISDGSKALEGAAEKTGSAGGAAEALMTTPVFKRDQLGGW